MEQDFLKGRPASFLVPHLLGNTIDCIDNYIYLAKELIEVEDIK